MQQAERALDHQQRCLRRRALGGGVIAVETRLDGLQVPVAELVPDEGVERLRGGGELELLVLRRDLVDRGGQAIEDPAVGGQQAVGHRHRVGVGVEQHEARRVEQLVREAASLVDHALGEAHVLRGAHLQQAVARGVSAVLVDQVERIDARAERLRHAPTVGGLDRRVDVHVGERDPAGERDAGHDHPRHPEVDDVPARDEDVAGVPRGELGRLIRPAERGVRPQRRREPGVEHVGRLLPPLALRLLDLHDVRAVGGEPDGQAVAPPELTRYAPGADRLHPVEVDLLHALRVEAHLLGLDDVDRRLGQLVHAAEPLQRDQRLDARAGALAEADGVAVRDLLAQGAALAQVLDRALVPFVGREPLPLGHQVGHPAVEADRGQRLKTVVAADLEIDRVVTRCDLEGAGAELDLDPLVGDDGDATTDHRHDRVLADHVRVAGILGMHGDRDVGQDRDGTHRGDHDLAATLNRVGHLVEDVIDVLVLDFEIRDRGRERHAPVDEVVVAVDVAALVQLDEDLLHGGRVAVVHREALARVVHRRAQALVLLDDRGARRLLPLPDPLDECLPPQVVARDAIRGQLALDDHLRGDAGVVGTGLPEDVAALHATPADQQILHRAVERVAHVQRAGHVRWRQLDAVRLARRRRVGREEVGLLPIGEDPTLDLGGLVAGAFLELCAAIHCGSSVPRR